MKVRVQTLDLSPELLDAIAHHLGIEGRAKRVVARQHFQYVIDYECARLREEIRKVTSPPLPFEQQEARPS